MSSTYHLICLSHDPGIVLDRPELSSGSGGRERVEHLLFNREEHPEVARHAGCDLVAGAFSYPLVEVGHADLVGRRVRWFGVSWLRLLYYARVADSGSDAYRYAATEEAHVWPTERLRRLWPELAPELAPEHGKKGSA